MNRLIEKAGAVLLREKDSKVEILLEYRDREYKDWTFPKGDIEKDESPKETAVRELKEETGYRIEIIKQLPDIFYEFELNGEKNQVCLKMFLAKVIDGHLTLEFASDRLKWMSLEEAEETLTHKNLKDYLKKIREDILNSHVAAVKP